jgi:acyl carrier protein
MASPASVSAVDAQILQRLKAVVQGRLTVEPHNLELAAKLAEVGVDSFALVELLFLAEEEFGIKIPVEGLNVVTVGDVTALIAKQLASKEGSDVPPVTRQF